MLNERFRSANVSNLLFSRNRKERRKRKRKSDFAKRAKGLLIGLRRSWQGTYVPHQYFRTQVAKLQQGRMHFALKHLGMKGRDGPGGGLSNRPSFRGTS